MAKAWKFGDDIDTDAIIPGRYLVLNEPKELAEHLFEGVRSEFREKVKNGDIIVAGVNFGCGSSREHAPLAIKGAGISSVVAKSFARIFFRNAVNLGLPPVECEHVDEIDEGDCIEVNLSDGILRDITKDRVYAIKPMPPFLREIMREGLVEYTKKRIKKSEKGMR